MFYFIQNVFFLREIIQTITPSGGGMLAEPFGPSMSASYDAECRWNKATSNRQSVWGIATTWARLSNNIVWSHVVVTFASVIDRLLGGLLPVWGPSITWFVYPVAAPLCIPTVWLNGVLWPKIVIFSATRPHERDITLIQECRKTLFRPVDGNKNRLGFVLTESFIYLR